MEGCIGGRRGRICIDDVSAHAIDSSDGVKASAMIFSLVETAKANYINTSKYSELFLTELQKHMGDKELSFFSDFIPWEERGHDECTSYLRQICTLQFFTRYYHSDQISYYMYLNNN